MTELYGNTVWNNATPNSEKRIFSIPPEKVGDFDTELCEEFFNAFVRESGITLHLRQLAGCNSHHILEACFKAFGRTLCEAVKIDDSFRDAIPSTKGVLG